MSNFKVGDRVSFGSNYPKANATKMTGTIYAIKGGRREPWASIEVDGVDSGRRWIRDLDQLTLVAATVALPADDFRELEAFWPDMQDMPDGEDIFLAQFGPPAGLDVDPLSAELRAWDELSDECWLAIDDDDAYLTAQAGSISSIVCDYETQMALGDGSGVEG